MSVLKAGCVVTTASEARLLAILARRGLEEIRRTDGPQDPRVTQTLDRFAGDAAAATRVAGPEVVAEVGQPVSAIAVDVLTVSDLVARTGKPDRTVRRWCQEGRWPSARQLAGGQWVVNAEDLADDE